MLRTLLIVLLVLFFVGLLPAWPYSANWGYFPAGGLLILAAVLLVFFYNGRGDVLP